MGVFNPEVPNYDGIACNDQGYTAAFEGLDSSFSFKTPTNLTSNVSQDAMTIEFWIKPTEPSFFVGDKKILFTLKDNIESLNQIRIEKDLEDVSFDLDKVEEETAELREFMKIYLDNGVAVCAPFGDDQPE